MERKTVLACGQNARSLAFIMFSPRLCIKIHLPWGHPVFHILHCFWQKSILVIFFTASAPECDIRQNLDSNEYPNIFVSNFWLKWISEYIRIIFLTRTNIRIYSYKCFCTNEYPNLFVSKNLIRMNVRINIRVKIIRIYLYFQK